MNAQPTREFTVDKTRVMVFGDIEGLTTEEIKGYIAEVKEKKEGEVVELKLFADEEDGQNFIGRQAVVKPVQFERIRRITGYLVGTLDRFNDAKRHEEADRVKHSVGSEMESL